jgi:hypothetical protein
MTAKQKKQQRGAALITVLMISTLLAATGGALVLVTNLAARTTYDATAEMQAYYAAEAGLQDTLNVLRGNVAPNAAMPPNSRLSFRGAITLAESNKPGDSSTKPTLSGWMNYNYTYGGESRVGLTANYSPINGLAYSVEVSDPDNIPVANGQPRRLLLRVTGYGPKGAKKQLELIVNRLQFNYDAPAMLMMIGAENCAPLGFVIGNSNAKEYTGHDRSSSAILPAFGATCDGDRDIEADTDGKETVALPKAATVTNSDLPVWLRSAEESRAFLEDQRALATSQNRYFASFSGNSGSSASPAFTFVDGDCSLDGGAGLLIVTGTLTMSGNPNFTGLILVLGGGTIQRDGGGNGEIYGAISVARFNSTGGFLAPIFNTNGGGTSTLQYDSLAVAEALGLSGPRVAGVHEY